MNPKRWQNPGDVGVRFMVAGQDVHAVRAGPHDLAHLVQTAAPTDQVAGGEVVVGVDGHQLLKRAGVVVEIGKHKQAGHSRIIEE